MDRETMIERLAEDLADSLLADADFRLEVARERFVGMDEAELRQCMNDAGLED